MNRQIISIILIITSGLYLSSCGSHSTAPVTPNGNGGPDDTTTVYVVSLPEGEFLMGSPYDAQFDADERPIHPVWLDRYYIGVFEVTNRSYAAFLTETEELQHWDANMSILRSGSGYAPEFGLEDHPVTYVNWYDAVAFCEWLGGRLPTEAEWEKAARGTNNRHIYPWGDQISPSQANFGDTGGTWKVGTAEGLSPYGCRDMAGNVWEWTADWYDSHYYSNSPYNNPTGPPFGEEKTIRGGGYRNNYLVVRCAERHQLTPDTRREDVGFRCAVDSLRQTGP